MERFGERVLKNASKDFKYLLDRGYRRTPALNFVADHYRLGKQDRNFIIRFVFSEKEIRNHKSKLIPFPRIRRKNLVIDTYNVLVTAQAVISGKEVVRGMDGFLRDTSAVFSKYRFNEETKNAIEKILDILSDYGPGFVLFILDSQISRSGELASYIRERLKEKFIEGNARVSRNADREIKNLDWITATSDSVIIEKTKNAVDIIKLLLPENSGKSRYIH